MSQIVSVMLISLGRNMNCLIYFLLFVSTFIVAKSKDFVPHNPPEEHVLHLLHKWRLGQIESLPFPLPPLDVIKIPGLNGDYSSKSLKMKYTTSEMELIGVSNFSVLQLNVSEKNLEVSGLLELPTLNITADNYNLTGRAYIVYKLTGAGPMYINMRNMKLLFAIHFGTDGTNTIIRDLQLTYNIEKIEVDLKNSSWPINKILNRDAVQIMDDYHDRIVDDTKNTLTYYLSDYLLTMSPQQLFSVVTNIDCSCIEDKEVS